MQSIKDTSKNQLGNNFPTALQTLQTTKTATHGTQVGFLCLIDVMIKWNEVIARLHLVALTSKHVGPAFTLARFTWAAKMEENGFTTDPGYAETVMEQWHFKWNRRRSTSEHSRQERLLGSAAGPPALLTWQHSRRYRPGSTQISLSKTTSRLRLEASMDQEHFQ